MILRVALVLLLAACLLCPARAAPPKRFVSGSATLLARVRVDAAGGRGLVSVSRSRDGEVFTLSRADGDDRFSFTVLSAARAVTLKSDFSPTPGLWYQLAGVRDAAARRVRFYVNGTRVASAPFPAAPALGGRGSGGATPGSASLADIHFYPRAFSDAEIAKLGTPPSTSRATFTWANPVFYQGDGPGDDIHDPDILQDGGVFYCVATLAPFRNYTDRDPKLPDLGSAPGIRLYASRDLKVWKAQRWLLKSSDLPTDCPYKHQFWAPEIHKLGRRYYLIFGGSNWIDDKYNVHGHMGYYQFVGVADRVGGPYRHFTVLDGPGVDTSLFEDDDGRTYAVWPGNEIHPIDLSRIDRDHVTVGPKISRAAGPDDYKALGLPVPGTLEGPYLIKRRGTYYCFFAATYPDLYATGTATAKSLRGPWTLDPRTSVFPGGHQAEFVGPDGRWWSAYKHERSATTPWLSLDPLDFDAQGRVSVTPTTGPRTVPMPPPNSPDTP